MTNVCPTRSAHRPGLTIILGMLAAFGSLSIDMYLPGLPTIAREFGTDAAAGQQTLAAFFLGMALGQIVYGPLSDRAGRRKPLLVGCGLYTVTSLGCAVVSTMGALVGLRFFQALGACAGIVIGRSIVRDLFDPRESARMYALLMLLMGAAPITAPFIGGQILAAVGWRAIFLALAAFGFACFVAVFFALPETLSPERRTQAGFVATARVYGGLLSDRRYMGYAAASALALGAMFAYITGSPFVFIELHGVRPDRYGLLFGTNALGLILASQSVRVLLRRFSSFGILQTGVSVLALAGLLLVAVAATGGGFPTMLVLLFVCVACSGLIQPNAIALALAPYGDRAGSASALLGGLQFAIAATLGGLVGIFHNGTALPMTTVIAVCGTLALLILLGTTRRLHREGE